MIRTSMMTLAGFCALVAFVNVGCTSHSETAQIKTTEMSTPLAREISQPTSTGDELLSTETARTHAKREEVDYLFSTSLHDAEHFTVSISNIAKSLNDTDIPNVNRSLSQLEVVRNLDPVLFTADQLHAYDVRLGRAKVAAQSAIERRQEWELQQRNQAAYDWIMNEQRQQELERKRTVEDLTIRLKALLG